MLILQNKHHRPETYEDGREGKISCQYCKQQCQLLIKERGNSLRANRYGLRCKKQTNKDWIRP
jgi:tryptophanyl-tRNA synthetase